MVWSKIDSSLGRLWLNFLLVFLWVMDWARGKSKDRPSPLKGLTITRGV